jgi:hypothetical protein
VAAKKTTAQKILAAPHEAVQWGMNRARKFIWKNMSMEQKARHLLRQVSRAVAGK